MESSTFFGNTLSRTTDYKRSINFNNGFVGHEPMSESRAAFSYKKSETVGLPAGMRNMVHNFSRTLPLERIDELEAKADFASTAYYNNVIAESQLVPKKKNELETIKMEKYESLKKFLAVERHPQNHTMLNQFFQETGNSTASEETKAQAAAFFSSDRSNSAFRAGETSSKYSRYGYKMRDII